MPIFTRNPKGKVFAQWAFLILLVAVLAVSLYLFVGNLETLRLRGEIRAHFRHQITAQRITPDQIRGWMTFRYVNVVLGLPSTYLQNALNIKNSNYPNLSLDALAKQQNISSAQMLGNAVAAVKSSVNKPLP